ncbi:MAG: hypothetical protein INQ03_09045 [Candidatus Heimdallarchaeota archaeon]|nr:hypothetical protein [Candidatus Heimdallarchaeota archaeon]
MSLQVTRTNVKLSQIESSITQFKQLCPGIDYDIIDFTPIIEFLMTLTKKRRNKYHLYLALYVENQLQRKGTYIHSNDILYRLDLSKKGLVKLKQELQDHGLLVGVNKNFILKMSILRWLDQYLQRNWIHQEQFDRIFDRIDEIFNNDSLMQSYSMLDQVLTIYLVEMHTSINKQYLLRLHCHEFNVNLNRLNQAYHRIIRRI